ncbi:pitrilysin family protein [Rickettsiella endosymbiont of Miltochrista miniata]|uniref:M16 family metallopeptidase n=1 Tax=Rickettsiella endosymbiont of Miltochrista miniata TaxID=3066239 RepID=UPI00313CDEEF
MHIKSFFYFLAFLSLFITDTTQAETSHAILKIEHWSTKNGVPVYFVAKNEIPIIDIGVLFHAGSAQDNNSPGIAQFTAQMLDQGTQNLNVDQIANRFEAVGAHYSAGVNQDMTVLNLRSLSAPQFFNPALSTFSILLKDAKFPEPAINRIKKQMLIALQQEAQTPSAIAIKTFYQTLYGLHPYASSILGNKISIEQLSQEKLLNFYHRNYVAKNAMIAIVGNVTQAKAMSIAEQLSSILAQGKASLPMNAPSLPHLKNHIIKVSYPSKQTTIFLGQIGIAVKDPDYFPLVVGNQILGGGILTSKLFNEVRNKRGLCYGINSGFKPLQVAGPFVIALQTRRDQAAKALSLTQQTLKNFLAKGPSTQELQGAKQALIGSFPSSISSNEGILAATEKIGFYQLPLDYLDTYQQKINSVNLEQIRHAFQRIKPEKMIVVMLGKQ